MNAETAWQTISLLGAWPVVLGLALLVSIWWRPRGETIKRLWIMLLGTELTVTLLKYLIQRPRPVGALPALYDSPFSFPSNHAALAAAFWGLAGYELWRLYPRWRFLIAGGTLVMIIFIGASRWLLGVHFVSDILGGYLIGVAWLMAVQFFRTRYFVSPG